MSKRVIEAAESLRDEISNLKFAEPVTHVYNPLDYAWKPHLAYLKKAKPRTCRVLFLGMNPGPWGMAQTGVPFGEIAAVRDYLKIHADVEAPVGQHAKRPIEGFACEKSEVSGRRLWGLFAAHYPSSDDFFREHFIANYCPLVFMESTARNRTPDKLPRNEQDAVNRLCDSHLRALIDALSPTYLVGVGAYAEKCLTRVCQETGLVSQKAGACQNTVTDRTKEKTGTTRKPGNTRKNEPKISISRILHPSPASPAANRGWAPQAEAALVDAGIWKPKA